MKYFLDIDLHLWHRPILHKFRFDIWQVADNPAAVSYKRSVVTLADVYAHVCNLLECVCRSMCMLKYHSKIAHNELDSAAQVADCAKF